MVRGLPALGRLMAPLALALFASVAAAAGKEDRAADDKGWILGRGGETCQQACLRMGHMCSEKHWPLNMDHLKAVVSSLNYKCEQYQEGSIRYDPSATGPYCGWLGDLRNRPQHRCTARPPISARRFCYCGKKAPAQNPVVDVDSATARHKDANPKHFDCEDGYHNRVVGWSVYKMVWCCREKNVGCEAGTSAPYDCNAGYSNWKYGWSYNKTVWCCAHEGRGCQGTKPPSSVTTQARLRALPPATQTTTTVTATTTSDPYDCKAGFSNWEKGWSDGKKSWCCTHRSRGCRPETTKMVFDCNAGHDRWQVEWSVEKKFWCCRYRQKGCSSTSEPFDCAAGYSNWLLGWSLQKKEWCCSNKLRGCLPGITWALDAATTTVTTATTHTSTSTITATTTKTATTISATTTSTVLFDCNAGFANWEAGWSDEKKAWCCMHTTRGCPVTTTQEIFDCDAGLNNFMAGWSHSKKDWCCEHEQKGCPVTTTTVAFDCDAGFFNWVAGWSTEKKDWCCQNKNVGCHTTTLADVFDCQAGLPNWVAGWSEEKKTWCCKNENLGCALDFEAPGPLQNFKK